MHLEAFVEGRPRGWTSRPKARRNIAPWRAEVLRVLKGFTAFEGPYRVQLSFVLTPPRSEHEKTQVTRGTDIDNLVKPVLDMMARSVLADGDGAVSEIKASKRIGNGVEKTGVLITVDHAVESDASGLPSEIVEEQGASRP